MTSLQRPSGWLCSWQKCLGWCVVEVGTNERWFSAPRTLPRPRMRWRGWPRRWPSSALTDASELICCRWGQSCRHKHRISPPWNKNYRYFFFPISKGVWTHPHHQHSTEDPLYCQSHDVGADKHQWGGVRAGKPELNCASVPLVFLLQMYSQRSSLCYTVEWFWQKDYSALFVSLSAELQNNTFYWNLGEGWGMGQDPQTFRSNPDE